MDERRLRRIVLKTDLTDEAFCVRGGGGMCEMRDFYSKLRVKELILRMLATISMETPVEDVLVKSKELMVSTFSVTDGDKVVSVVSDREIFITLFKLLRKSWICRIATV